METKRLRMVIVAVSVKVRQRMEDAGVWVFLMILAIRKAMV